MQETPKQTVKGILLSPEKASLISKVKNTALLKKEIEKAKEETTSELLEAVIGGSIQIGASDVHMEPEKETVKLRARLDGLLQDISVLSKEEYEDVLSRIKLIAGIKLNVEDRPQDGRFSVFMEGEESLPIEIRISTLPAEYGETIVARILNPKSLISLADLGLRKDLLETFKKEIKKPNGMIIITGPTGSGKTTTLYAFLKEIQSPEVKIITIEDPIEYHLKGISQTQVSPDKGYDFASGLQSIMRQDPDVILVGEIRDPKTSKIAIQAALTGHLVFSTLHTNDAAGTIARMISLEGDIKNIGPAINMTVAQRLLRKVCPKCLVLENVSKEEEAKIRKVLSEKTLKQYKFSAKSKIAHAKGCEYCNFTGYRGRVGVFEAFLIDADMEKFILNNPSIADLQEKAVKDGMVTMMQDGFIKILENVTTIEEVERIMGEE
jgi:type II secretory ATPase GspE/PulE/Tfp pilus assembly ATPase PilB-like protein